MLHPGCCYTCPLSLMCPGLRGFALCFTCSEFLEPKATPDLNCLQSVLLILTVVPMKHCLLNLQQHITILFWLLSAASALRPSLEQYLLIVSKLKSAH